MSSLVSSLPNLRVLRMLGTQSFDRDWPMDALRSGHAASLTRLEVYNVPFNNGNTQPHLVSDRVETLNLLSTYTCIYAADLPRLRVAFPSLWRIKYQHAAEMGGQTLQLQPHNAATWLPMLQQLTQLDFWACIVLGDGWPALADEVGPLQCLEHVAWEARSAANWSPRVLAIAPSAVQVELCIGPCSPEQRASMVRDVVAGQPRMRTLRLTFSTLVQPWDGLEAALLAAQHLRTVVLCSADRIAHRSSKTLCAANGNQIDLLYPRC